MGTYSAPVSITRGDGGAREWDRRLKASGLHDIEPGGPEGMLSRGVPATLTGPEAQAETTDYYALAASHAERLVGRVRAVWALHAAGATMRWISLRLRGRHRAVSLRDVHEIIDAQRTAMLRRARGIRGRGRPPNPGGYSRDGVVMTIRLTDAQAHALDAIAAHLGVTPRVAIRAAILTAARSL